MEQLNALGCYTLAGKAEDPHVCIQKVPDAKRLGIGVNFISERFNFKEAAIICGALEASCKTSGIATGTTNMNTRNAMVTASFGVTTNCLTQGRFAFCFAAGVAPLMNT